MKALEDRRAESVNAFGKIVVEVVSDIREDRQKG